ncbi:hypothetical protein Tco_1466715 [Tanacetum coccineum]
MNCIRGIRAGAKDHGGRPKPIYRRDQIGVLRKYLHRETPQRSLPWNGKKKSLSNQDAKRWADENEEIEALQCFIRTCRQEVESDQEGRKPWYDKKPGNKEGESSSVPAKGEDPQGKDKDKAGIEEALEALEEGMTIKTQFGVRLESNMEEEAEQGSITDSNDFEVIV